MELKDWLNSINFTKEDLSENIKDYPSFIINKCMSGHIDTIMFANEMNMAHHLSKDMQYKFYINILRKKKRFAPWLRKNNIDDISVIQKYYGYSFEKAQQALKILSIEQIDYIKSKLDLGGKDDHKRA
tara:strand:+ start:1043 stop:1426 length:384 start_codon:yes stop_codon:yes gene_type:complete